MENLKTDEEIFIHETTKHMIQVEKYLDQFSNLLRERADTHDESKFSSKEKPLFIQHTAQLQKLTYGSLEYQQSLDILKPALNHHYRCNRHHPEHILYKSHLTSNKPINMKWMNLVDVVEMLADWQAASLRHKDGDIMKSIEINQKRFNYSDDMKELFKNTVRFLNWI